MFTQANEEQVWRQVQLQRSRIAIYIATLPEEDWNTLSLCEGWKVRDVIAHLTLVTQYSIRNSWFDYVRSGFNTNRFFKQTAIRRGKKSPEQLIQLFESMITSRQKPNSISGLNVLADLMVHEQDIRIPLKHPQAMLPEALHLIFENWRPKDYNAGEKIASIPTHVEGIQFVVTDLGITVGKGLRVEGNASDILMAMLGRSISYGTLQGPGIKLLRQRSKKAKSSNI